MPHIVWELQASRDLNRLFFFLYEKNPNPAIRAIDRIESEADMLIAHPGAGSLVAGVGPYRQLLVPFGKRPYILTYSLDADEIRIHTVRHSRELPRP